MLYASVMVFSLIASCYLLFRRANAIAPNITSSVRLRRFTAAFLGSITLSYLLYLPLIYMTSVEDIQMLYFVGAMFDFLTCFPLVIAILFTMLQDHRRRFGPLA
jgi:ABC-type tungstate transport system substrate-binding protein